MLNANLSFNIQHSTFTFSGRAAVYCGGPLLANIDAGAMAGAVAPPFCGAAAAVEARIVGAVAGAVSTIATFPPAYCGSGLKMRECVETMIDSSSCGVRCGFCESSARRCRR